ncbi:hypothetical protein [Actinomadura flavalba]|uniref:hypothetical protein n=1 Tax=Actinomadura flavalba TaxID=1120938 RepID=UPI00037D3715|nr:hypothetical protein [Actinomadura flavalba]
MTQPQSTLDEIKGMLVAVIGHEPRAALGPDTTLHGDLDLEPAEFTDLTDRLAARYGDDADVPGLLAALDIDELIALTIGNLAAHIDAPDA